MVSSRRERIEAMLREEPGDVFLRYALAMELSKEGRQQESLDLSKHPARPAPGALAAGGSLRPVREP
ncbi:MAG: hypothetical protein ACKN9U_06470, partial [Pirellulaceae bacterium]